MEVQVSRPICQWVWVVIFGSFNIACIDGGFVRVVLN